MFSAISDSRWIAVCIYLHTLRELSSEYANALTGFLALLPPPHKSGLSPQSSLPLQLQVLAPGSAEGGVDREGVCRTSNCALGEAQGQAASASSKNTARNQCPPSPTSGLPLHT